MGQKFKQDEESASTRFFGDTDKRNLREIIFEGSPIAIYELDLSSLKIKWMNNQVSRLLGYTEEYLLAVNIPDLLVDSSKEIFRQNIAKALQSKKNFFNTEVQVKTKKGTTLWGLFSSKVLYLNGKPSSVLVFAQDITEHKKAEEKLKESEARFSKAFSSSPAVLAITRVADNRFVDVNDTFLLLTKFKRAEVIGHTSKELNLFPYPRERDRIINSTLSNDVSYNNELSAKTKDGKLLKVVISSTIITINGEKYILSTVIDVTDLRKAEEAQKNANSEMQSIMDSVDDGIALVDVDGKVLDCNKASLRLLGLTRSDFIGRNVYDVIVPEDRQRAIDGALRVLETGKIVNEVRVQRKNSSPFYAEISVTALHDWNGKPIVFLGVTRDISERKKMEEELREREQLYRTLFENTDDGFMLVEPVFDGDKAYDIRFLKLNEAYERQTGAKSSDVLGKTTREARVRLEEEYIASVERVLKTSRGMHFERYNEQSKRWFDTYCFPYAEGQVGMLFRDITQRKKTEQELAGKQKELSQILNSSPTIIFYKDKAGKFIEANNAFGEALKIPKEKILGKTVFDLYSPEIAQQMRQDDLIVMDSKQPKIGIIEPYESPTGLRWIRTDKIPSFDEKGLVNGVVGFSEDITEHKKAEDALIESEAKYEQLVNRLPEMVFEINNKGRVTFANSRAIETLGYTKAELENFDANRFVIPEEANRSRENMKLMFTGKIRNSNEYTFVKKDGTQFPVLLNSVPIVKDNKVVGTRGLVIDITERKNLEKKMQENERVITIGQIARMVGHDIRNPLQAIAGELYLAKQDMTKAPDSKRKEEATESLSFVQAQLDYINKIVSDLQDYARPLQPDISEIELTGLIHEILQTISFPENVNLLFETDGCLQCRTDQMFIRRALTNLVNNAIQAMPNGGDLKIGISKKEDKAAITVADTGMGIPEEIKAKLFTPMVTTKAKGQGLGLAVVKRLVESLNGNITFESETGKGTKFTIELPA